MRSPPGGCSTLTTSAPRAASLPEVNAAGTKNPRSSTFTPANGEYAFISDLFGGRGIHALHDLVRELAWVGEHRFVAGVDRGDSVDTTHLADEPALQARWQSTIVRGQYPASRHRAWQPLN